MPNEWTYEAVLDQAALAIYGAGKDGKSPVKDKQQLIEELRKSVADATAFCATHGVTLSEIECGLAVGADEIGVRAVLKQRMSSRGVSVLSGVRPFMIRPGPHRPRVPAGT